MRETASDVGYFLNDSLGATLRALVKLLGLAVIRLIDWIWWGSSGRAGLAGAAWHIKVWLRPARWIRDLLRMTDRVPRPVVVALIAGCFLLWVGVAIGALDFLGIVDAD